MLDKLASNDRIYVDYKGTRYIYRISSTKVVPPTDISVLNHGDDPQLTLITCTPVGTNKNRLIVQAKQISPDPGTATELDVSQTAPIGGVVIPN
jgi:sortase A